MTPQPDALPACPPDPALVRGQRFHRALAASMTHVGTDHYGCGHCPRCADFCDGFVAGCESESAQSDIAHALAASRAEVERLRKLVAPTVGDGPLWDQKIPGPTDELRKRWDTEANHAFCMSSDIGDQAQFVKGYVAAKYRDWYWYEIICQREHRAALAAQGGGT